MRTTQQRITLAVFGAGIALGGCAEQTPPPATTITVAKSPTASAAPQMAAVNHAGMGHGKRAIPHAMGTQGMESLRAKTGVAFDKAYLSQMIAHHEAAVQMAKDILKATKNANTKRDADAVIASQAAQIARMTGWLRSWYKDAPLPAEVALVNKDMAGMMAMPADTDAMFYTMMIPHHQGAIDMSELALKNSGRAEVKALARKIIAEQRAEIAAYATKLPDG